MTPPRPDPLDAVLREAHRRGQVVLYHPAAGLIVLPLDVLDAATQGALARLDQMTPWRPAGGGGSS
jgi:hypothetical protein